MCMYMYRIEELSWIDDALAIGYEWNWRLNEVIGESKQGLIVW